MFCIVEAKNAPEMEEFFLYKRELLCYNTSRTEKLGPVAQLGAHHIRIVGVVGSNPIRSTRFRKITANWAVIFLFISSQGE